jgi:hypothetical protein
MGATMGSVPPNFIWVLGWGSIIAGIIIIVAGAVSLLSAGIKIPKAFIDTQAIDVGKLLEALSKLPQWAVAIMLGNVQIFLGFWMLDATLFGYKLFPN